MVFVIILYVVASVFIVGVVYLFQHFLRVVINLFLGITIKTVPDEDKGIDGEVVQFKATDGVILAGIYIPAKKEPLGTIIFNHEFGSDMYSVKKYAGFLWEEGFNVFSFTYRRDGKMPDGIEYNPIHWVTKYELHDLNGAIHYVKSRPDYNPDKGLGLMGISRGATIALCTAAENPDIRVIVTDSAFDTRRTLDYYMRKWIVIFAYIPLIYNHMPNFVYKIFEKAALKISEMRLRINFIHLEERVPDIKAAVFYIHGQKDNYIDPSQAEYLYEITKTPKDLWIVPTAKHNQSYHVQPRAYRERITAFLKRTMIREPSYASLQQHNAE